jgi:hypothetical protein
MFDHDQFHDPEFRTLVRTARAVIAERVRRGIATPPERLAVAALDEMPDEDDPAAVRAWAPSAAFRDAGALIGTRDAGALRTTSASSRRSPTKPTETTAAARRCTDGGAPAAGER